jgi:hypothetical protein
MFDAEFVVTEDEGVFRVLVHVGESVSLLFICGVQVVLLIVMDLLVETDGRHLF